MRVRLVVIGGKANKGRVSVELPTVVGRSREADLTVAHPMISRKHCELFEVDGLVMIRDLGSLNGLFVGGTQVTDAALHPNAEFSVGPLTFRVEYEYAGEVAGPHDATTVNETDAPVPLAGPPEGAEIDEEGPDFEVGAPQPPPPDEGISEGEQAADAGDEAPPDAQPGIGSSDGELPDFSAWEAGGTEKAEDEQAAEILPPPPSFPGGQSGQEELASEADQAEPPDSAPASATRPPVPETMAFDQGPLAEGDGPSPPS
jgi:pSer/pThr/pTyr-binding forkhead associated (FHA) protein